MNNNVFWIYSLYLCYSNLSLSSIWRATHDVIYSRSDFALKEHSGLVCCREKQKWNAIYTHFSVNHEVYHCPSVFSHKLLYPFLCSLWIIFQGMPNEFTAISLLALLTNSEYSWGVILQTIRYLNLGLELINLSKFLWISRAHWNVLLSVKTAKCESGI